VIAARLPPYDEAVRVLGLIVLALWLAFGVYWLAAATRANSTRRRAGLRGAVGRLLLLILAVLLLRGNSAWRISTAGEPAIQALGVLLMLGGMGLAVWARVHLGRNWGMPMTVREAPELVTDGPYRYVRHPIYTGLLLGVAGTSLALNLAGLIVCALLAGYFTYAARVEERTMRGEFPDAYPAYCAHTKMLIPFVL
jgi:protein-S-isoprenylcysteine O-methyltransferase Ste14